VWLPGDLRAPLVQAVQAAQLAASRGDQPTAHGQLAQLRALVLGLQGKALSGHDAARLLALIDPLQAQVTPTSTGPVGTPSPVATATAPTPGASATATPPPAPGTPTVAGTPTAADTPAPRPSQPPDRP
jgi:hypothetical protein